MNSKFFKFKGGATIHQGEELSNQFPIKMAPLFENYTVSLLQNIGKHPTPIVVKGDLVKRGQLIAKADGFFSSNLHAPTSGVVKGIIEIPTITGQFGPAIEIESDGEDVAGFQLAPIDQFLECDPKLLLNRIIDAGIVGKGGAAFPTHVKLSPPPDKKIDFLVINGAECEPYLTTDERTMIEFPEKIIKGIAMVSRILGVRNVAIGVEENKPNSILRLREFAPMYGIDVVELPVRYPQGAEKQLIYALTGRRVPTAGLPMDVGVVVQNIGTCMVIAEAVLEGKPLYERGVTVTGYPLVMPSNFFLRIGTPIYRAIALAGGIKEQPAKVIIGGPMMGFAQRSLDVTICKNTSGVLLLSKEELSQYQSHPCIRCGRCVDACPMNLLCSTLSVAAECEDYVMAEKLHAMDCMECGSCAYVCPSYRPLVQHLRRCKGEILAERRKNQTK